MFHDLNSLFQQAAIERATLLVNHLLQSEPLASSRLQKHAGRCMQFQFENWPPLLPRLPVTVFRITPAGLVEWCGLEAPADPDLRVTVDAGNPALAMVQALSGTRPKVEVAGDAALAADLNWLFDNLRWDMEDDLAKVVGPALARQLANIAGGVAAGMRAAVQAVGDLVARGRDMPPPPPR